jgi:hypothetical protein
MASRLKINLSDRGAGAGGVNHTARPGRQVKPSNRVNSELPGKECLTMAKAEGLWGPPRVLAPESNNPKTKKAFFTKTKVGLVARVREEALATATATANAYRSTAQTAS